MKKQDYKKIFDVMKKINSPASFQGLLTDIIDAAKILIDVEGSSLLLLDRERGVLIFDIVISDKGEIIKGKTLPLGKGIAGYVAKTGEYVISNDVSLDERFYSEIDHLSGFKTRSILAVPVSGADGLVGVLEVVNPLRATGFTDDDLDVLTYLADAAAIAIRNHELLINLRNNVSELTSIYVITQSMQFTPDVSDFLARVLQTVNEVIRAEKCSLALLDEQRTAVKHFASTEDERHEIKLENSLMAHVINTGEPILVQNIDRDAAPRPPGISRGRYNSSSFICLPITFQRDVIGVLNVTDKPGGEAFTTHDLRILSAISSHLAKSYMNIVFQLKAKEAEYKLLQKQMSPHFLFNALNSIHSMLYRNDAAADQAIFKLAQFYRFLQEKASKTVIPFDDEWQFLKNYLDMESMQFGDDLSVQIECTGDFGRVSIPPLTLQPIVENSLKHGVKNAKRTGAISITAATGNGETTVDVLDNGVGLPAGWNNKRSLHNISQRLDYLFENSRLDVRNRPEGGVHVRLSFGRPRAAVHA